jgi:HD-GYP domain-containing protein (c-di-GMP phosphodiesterase class II)
MSERVRIDTNNLQVGMYVVEVDRPWLDTPFPFQGFHVRDLKELQQIRHLCRYVYVDPDLTLGKEPAHLPRAPGAVPFSPKRTPKPGNLPLHQRVDLAPPVTPRYRDMTLVEEEITAAREVHTRTRQVIDNVFNDVRLGHALPSLDAKEAVSEMVESVIRNPDALVWLTHLKKKDDYTSIHSMNVCILALAFGRYLGLSKNSLLHIGIGGLLHDVGKMRVKQEILIKPDRLTEDEMEQMRNHAVYGRDILLASKDIPSGAADIAWSHHERMDGTGYPRGLKGESIGYFSRITGIIDVYDAITSERIYHNAITSLEALEKMYEWRGTSFDTALVEQFIQCLGIYPTGSEVEMSSGEVGVVISVNRVHRLRPKVLLILDADKTLYDPPRLVDLVRKTHDDRGEAYGIHTVLERGAYNINVKELLLEHALAV